MSAPVSFTIRPPSRSGTPSTSSPAGSPSASREQSTAADEARNAAAHRQAVRISAAPSRPSPLGPGIGRNGRSGQGGRDKYGRMTFAHGDEEDSEDDEAQGFRVKGKGRERDEEITGFGEGGAESKNTLKAKGPLVIPALPNKDWRQSSMSARKPTYVPEKRTGPADTTVEREGDEPVRAGLQLMARTEVQVEAVVMSDSDAPVERQDTPAVPETLEQRAMRELMITAENGAMEPNQHADMVIGLQTDTLNLRDMPVDETDAYRRDVLTRPEVSTLDDYSEVPIEAFGEAMLRGMGWKPEAARTGPGVHVPQRRPEGLGLGATARAAPIDEKGKKAKRKEDAKSRGGRGYVPVVKRERDTPSESRNESPTTSSSLVRSRAASRSPSPRSEDSRRRGGREDRGTRREGYDSDRRQRNGDRDRSDRLDRERDRRDMDRGDLGDNRQRDRDMGRSRHDDRDKSRYDDRDGRDRSGYDRDRERRRNEREDDYRRSYRRDDRSDKREDRGYDSRDLDRR